MATIEEKAKRYDEIIEKATKMHNENCEACKACIEELIPELKDRFGEEYGKVGDCIDWLKSLKERYTWKPSEEQIYVLDEVIRNPHLSTAEYNGLIALKEQLKAQKEE